MLVFLSAPLLFPVLGGDLLQSVTMVGDHALLVVKNNDIYYLVGKLYTVYIRSFKTSSLQPNLSKNDTIRLTDSGQEGLIYNGVTDWLYEGCIFLSLYVTKILSFSRRNSLH